MTPGVLSGSAAAAPATPDLRESVNAEPGRAVARGNAAKVRNAATRSLSVFGRPAKPLDYTPDQIAEASDAWLAGLCDEINRAERAAFSDVTLTEQPSHHLPRFKR